MRCPWFRVLIAGFALGIALTAPAAAFAQEAEASAEATSVYELDFTLPSESRSGCMVCHGDPALVRIREGEAVSFYIDEADTAASTHADQQCVGCHVDFAYRAPHGDENWSITARSACRNCHEDQSRSVGESVHRPVVATEATDDDPEAVRPLCGDCHGSHDIAALTEAGGEDWKDGKAALHADGWQVCGRCHEDYWDSYSDYYHGAAYKRGAADAPACWDCHGWHDILPSDDRGSMVNESHLVETCGQEGCHDGVDETYTEYAAFIHTRDEVADNHPIISIYRSISRWFGGLFGGDDKS